MFTNTVLRVPMVALLSFALLFFGAPVYAAPETETQPEPEPKSENVEEVQDEVEADVESRADEKRERIIEEAVAAINQTEKAIEALEKEDADEALAALERVTGKLEIILARQPDLALAPMDVAMTTYDVYASVETIEAAIKEARKHLKDGNVQAARRMLDGLASEVVFSVTNIPLATYSDAIKAVVPLIDEGKLEEAQRELRAALNTLVVTKQAVPLPPMRAEALLEDAEELAETSDRTEEENERLAQLLDDARTELQIAEILGYGMETDFSEFYAQLDEIERKTKGGKSGKGFFDAIRESLDEMRESIFG